MDIKRSGSQPSAKGPADYFTGTVRIDPLFEAPAPARVRRRERHLRARRPHGLAYPSARSDPDRHLGLRTGAALGRPDRGNPAGRRGVDSAGREALAWRRAEHRDDAISPFRRRSTAVRSRGWKRSATSNTGTDAAASKIARATAALSNVEGICLIVWATLVVARRANSAARRAGTRPAPTHIDFPRRSRTSWRRSSRTGRRRRLPPDRAGCSRATCAPRPRNAGTRFRRCPSGRSGRAWRSRNCCWSSCCRSG